MRATPPPVPEQIMRPFLKANLAFPQMYGMMIIRAGRVVVDMLADGELTVEQFAQTCPSRTQIESLIDAAAIAHERVGIAVPVEKHPMYEETLVPRTVTPYAINNIYLRMRFGVLDTIHNHGCMTVDLGDEESDDISYDQKLVANKLFGETANRASALLLRDVWQTADNALTGPPVASATATLHDSLSHLPSFDNQNACQFAIATATRVARTALNAQLVPALEPLKHQAYEVLGNPIRAEDVIDSFPLMTLYEGRDEYTDSDLLRILQR